MKRSAACAVMVAGMPGAATDAWALDAKTALDKLGFPADAQAQVLAGQFVEAARCANRCGSSASTPGTPD